MPLRSGDRFYADNGVFSDDVFARRRIPWKGISLAVVLLFAGTLSILFGSIFLYSDVTADRHGESGDYEVSLYDLGCGYWSQASRTPSSFVRTA